VPVSVGDSLTLQHNTGVAPHIAQPFLKATIIEEDKTFVLLSGEICGRYKIEDFRYLFYVYDINQKLNK
jgi:hypothetical protein